MVASNRGFLPLEKIGSQPSSLSATTRIPVQKAGKPIIRKYCAFWKKEGTNYYVEEFARMLKKNIQDNTKQGLS